MVICGLALVTITGCGLLGAPPAAPSSNPEPSPTLLPAPRSISSPQPGGEPSPVASPASSAPPPPPTRIPPPNLDPGAAPAGAASGRARVANTEGQGANMRAEPAPGATLVRTVRDGTELELIGAEREGGGRQWRNVRDPASGASGWIVSELLEIVSSEPPAPAASPAGEPKPGTPAKPEGEAKPAGAPKPGASPAAGAPAGAAKPTTSIGDEDRAYLTVLQDQVDVLGKAITSANEQIERAGGRPEVVSDATWQKDTEAVIDSLRGAAAKIREAKPGPATGEVHRFARNAADRAEEVANGLSNAIESKDARALVNTRTTLVRLLAEINNMNLALLDLQ
jgi:hypothetical protein